ncbi:MAG: hypothetical protein HUJ74_04270 [Lachnospiraceae bacterium]|nr:hypothetical protein [Lachnospiraceae bacterium]
MNAISIKDSNIGGVSGEYYYGLNRIFISSRLYDDCSHGFHRLEVFPRSRQIE